MIGLWRQDNDGMRAMGATTVAPSLLRAFTNLYLSVAWFYTLSPKNRQHSPLPVILWEWNEQLPLPEPRDA
jgi:hypothetical protein